MEVWQRNTAFDFWLTSKDFASVLILKSTSHWKAFHPHPTNLGLHRVFSKRFKSAINKFCSISAQTMGRKKSHEKKNKNRKYGSRIKTEQNVVSTMPGLEVKQKKLWNSESCSVVRCRTLFTPITCSGFCFSVLQPPLFCQGFSPVRMWQ